MLKNHVTPNARSAKICIFVAISLNRFPLKFVAIQNSLLIFCDPPISHEKNSVTPSFFMAPLFGRK